MLAYEFIDYDTGPEDSCALMYSQFIGIRMKYGMLAYTDIILLRVGVYISTIHLDTLGMIHDCKWIADIESQLLKHTVCIV